jgi:hypothetical protein
MPSDLIRGHARITALRSGRARPLTARQAFCYAHFHAETGQSAKPAIGVCDRSRENHGGKIGHGMLTKCVVGGPSCAHPNRWDVCGQGCRRKPVDRGRVARADRGDAGAVRKPRRRIGDAAGAFGCDQSQARAKSSDRAFIQYATIYAASRECLQGNVSAFSAGASSLTYPGSTINPGAFWLPQLPIPHSEICPLAARPRVGHIDR